MIATPKESAWNNRKKHFRRWLWRCPIEHCGAHGAKPLAHSKAQSGGRCHLRRFHSKEYFCITSEKIHPILEKVA